jgi:prepilin-type N-terminal cleavage/methylation domain-containing protein
MKKRNYRQLLTKTENECGFTLIELLIVLFILAIITLIVIAALNPIEQLNKARDGGSRSNAENLLSAIERYQTANSEHPAIFALASSTDCNEIIQAGPVYDLSALDNELSDWFPKQLTEKGSELYVGMNQSGRTKVCYRVFSLANIESSSDVGCSEGYLYYNCLPQ